MGKAHAVRVAESESCQGTSKVIHQLIRGLVIPTERSDEGSQKIAKKEILRFAQKRSSLPEGAKGNDKVSGFFIILSCWSAATRNLKKTVNITKEGIAPAVPSFCIISP